MVEAILAEGRAVSPGRFALLSALFLAIGIAMLVFRRHFFGFYARTLGLVFPRFFDVETREGQRTLLFNFTIVPVLWCALSLCGLVVSIVEMVRS